MVKGGKKCKTWRYTKFHFLLEKYYKDEIVCNLVEMDDCHVLWGQPWYCNVDATYKRWDNKYIFWWYDKKIVLVAYEKQFVSTSVNNEKKVHKVDDEVK